MTAIFGDSDARRVRVFEDTGNTAKDGPRTFRVQRVGSDATVGTGTALAVNRTSWVLTDKTAPAGIRFGTITTTTAGPGVDPGEVWSLTGIVDTHASKDSKNAVGVYGQGVRRGLPDYGVGVPVIAGVMEATSLTGANSSVDGQIRGLEIDLKANGADDHPGVGREVLTLVMDKGVSSGPPPHVTSLIGAYAPSGVTITYGFRVNAITWTSALIDGRGGGEAPFANTIWLKTGQHIALNTAGTTRLSSDATTITLDGEIKIGAAGAFSANGEVATALTSVGPPGANTTVQEWLEVTNAAGTKRYIPCF